MKTHSTRARLLASSMICGVAALALGGHAFAQEQESTEVQELVVTGSRIPQPNLTSVSPVTAVNNEQIKLEGTTRVEDLLNSLPMTFAAQTSEVSNGATGTATVDLRGLGAERTLVLVNGRRLIPGDPQAPVADLNFVPAALVDRVDVVTGGASAVYGADAVAGVVNFIMLKNFEGVRLEAQVSGYQHHNDNDAIQALNSAKGYPLPSENVWDGAGIDLTAIIGINSPDGRGNATVYATYRHVDAITQDKRDYSNCSLNETGTGVFTCGGSPTSAPARLWTFDTAFDQTGDFIVGGATPGTIRDRLDTDVFNFAPYNYYQRPDERYTFGAFAHYEINKAATVYTELMFMDDRTYAVIAPSGIFGATVFVPCDNPLLSAAQRDAICTAGGWGPDDSAPTVVFRRNVEGGGRSDDLRHTDYRIVTGVRGDIGRGWSYDLYGQYGAVVFQQVYRNDFSLSRAALALDVVDDGNGNAVCRSSLDPTTPVTLQGCVPYDIFGPNGPSTAALNYLQTPGFSNGINTESIVSGQLTGNLGEYGIKSPMANDGVGIALGAEYRRETLDFNVDIAFATGDLAGQGGPTTPVEGAFDVMEAFGEIRIPLVQDTPFFHDLSFEGGYRYSDYSTGINTSTYKLALNWAPVEDIRFRASYNRAVRAPNIVELFSPQGVQLGLSADPCAGPDPEFTLEQCINTGVLPGQYGNILSNPANQYNSLGGGNPDLSPETADTYTVGFVFTPTFFRGFSFSADYFDITVEDTIAALSPDLVLETCGISGDTELCALVLRAPITGSLWLGGGLVVGTNVNIGFLKTSGVDFESNWRLPLADWGMDSIGGLDISFQGTWLRSLEVDPGIPALDEDSNIVATSFDCAGFFGIASFCGTPNPEWRHRLRVTWTTPLDGLGLSVQWRHFGGVKYEAHSTNPYLNGPFFPEDNTIDAQNYFDLTATWRVKDNYTLRLGVNNVFDRDPPLIGGSTAGASAFYNGNTYPGVYDALGRYLFMSVTADF